MSISQAILLGLAAAWMLSLFVIVWRTLTTQELE